MQNPCKKQLLGECHCRYTRESPRTYDAKFYGRLRLIRSVLRAPEFSVLKVIEIVIVCVHHTVPFGFSLFCHFCGITFHLLFKVLCWTGIPDEFSEPKMGICSKLLMKSDLNRVYIIFFYIFN